jgi:hypothetical protein
VGVGLGWIAPRDRDRVKARLLATGRTLVEFDTNELDAFAGNMLELRGTRDQHVLVLSATASAALSAEHRAALASATDELAVAAVPTIELRGGGSVRCMLAEVP